MHLWNEYEGKTLAGVYPLGTLLRTEGRSASFVTRDRAGQAAVIRLTEALNDQEVMRARYARVQAVAHPNLVGILDFGDTELEGEPVVYLVSERTEESLAEIVRERRLSLEETHEVATSLVGAVETLHGQGLVHGQVEPASVLAVGEVIKLRTDCVRPAPEDAEGERARQQDVFGVADVLNRALTQQPLQDASDALALPEPYASIVRNVVRGSWGIEQVAGEVRRQVRGGVPARAGAASAEPVAAARPVMAAAAGAAAGSDSTGHTVVAREGGKAREVAESGAQLPLVYSAEKAGTLSTRAPIEEEERAGTGRRPLILVALAVGVLVLLLLVWRVSARSTGTGEAARPASTAAVTPGIVAAPAAAPESPAAPVARKTSPAAESQETSHAAAVAGPVAGGKVWRVVAYTYNRESQAQAKVRFLEGKHGDLQPQVFSRTGGAPYLVTLGGSLSQEQAAAMRQRARGEGLPRDVYMQNYSH